MNRNAQDCNSGYSFPFGTKQLRNKLSNLKDLEMKRMNYLRLIILAFYLVSSNLFSQEIYEIKRGERPPIELSKVPPEAYEPGKLKIKVHQQVFETLGNKRIAAGASGYVETGIEALDELNRSLEVSEYKPLFSSLYETNAKALQNEARHQAWGLHLWFELTVDAKTDIPEAVQMFASLKDVEFAEPEYKKQLVIDDPDFLKKVSEIQTVDTLPLRWSPNDPQYSSQWHYNNTGQQSGTPGADIKLQNAWEFEKGYNGVIVAVIDGGIQINHSDLAANMWSGIGYNFVSGSSTIVAHNHGTHVAGTVAAVNNNNIGVAGVAGGTGSGDGVRLMSCQVFTSNSSGGFHIAPIYAADNGASISQNSWGYTQVGVYDASVLEAIDYFNVNGGGSSLIGGITIFAAGNSNASGQWYPGCYTGAFSVAATNNQDKKAWYSNYDTWVDVSAPGGETNSVTARGVLSSLTGNTYGYYQGTSMACPHVSGIAALVASLAQRNGLSLLNTDVKNILRNTTDDHYAVNTTFTGKLGTGRVNAYKALVEVQDMLSGIMNPLFLNADALGANQVNLSWQKNPQGDNVVLAWALEDSIGSPVDGIVYEVGQSLPGNGTILYKGALESFEHIDLMDATTYFYRIWSVNDSIEYSSGREASASTDCELYSQLPYIQDFNASSNTPNCWAVIDNKGNGQVWKFGRGAIFTGTTGNFAYLNSDAYGSGNSQNSDLVSQVFDFSGYTDITLSFTHYFRQYSSASTARLFYSINNGLTWITLQTWTSSTPNPASFNQIIPEIAGQGTVKFKWNFTGTWAYYWSIDDIGLSGTITGPSTYFTAEPTNALVGETITFSDAVGSTNYSTWEWVFGDGADPPAASGQGPHEVVYYTNGEKTISLTLDGIYSEIKTDYVSVNEQLVVYNEDFEPAATFTAVPAGWDIKRNTAADGGLNGNNLVDATADAWILNTLTDGLTPPETYIKNGQASLAINYTAPDFTWAISPQLAIPSDYLVELSFWLWYAYDAGQGPKPTNFYLAVFSEGSWNTLQSWVGQQNNLYQDQQFINITDYAGKTVRFGFVYQQTGAYPVALDDIIISSEAPPYWVWLGAECVNWHNPVNWTKGVPDVNSDVVILACELNPMVSTGLEVHDLMISAGSNLKIAPGGELTVHGEIKNNGGSSGLVLLSNTATPLSTIPDASLLHSTSGVEATVQRYISGDPMAWHQLSSPVDAFSIDAVSPGNFNDGSFMTWYEPANTWVNYTNTMVWPTWADANSGNTFLTAKAYLAAYNDNPVKEFSGMLNQGEISFGLSQQAHPDDNPGFNLVGNPYPSSIDWKAESGWDRSSLVSSGNPAGYTIWIWNPDAGQYGAYNSSSLSDEGTNNVTRNIAPMQGFWVRAAQNGLLTMNNDVRVHSQQYWIKNAVNKGQILNLAVSTVANPYRDEISLEFGHADATGGAEKFFSMKQNAPGLWSEKEGKKWSISFMQVVNENELINLGFKPGISSIHTIEATGLENFEGVILEDLFTATMHDFKQLPSYSFISNTTDDTNRFRIHFEKSAIGLGSEPVPTANLVFVADNRLYIQNQSLGSVTRIYDLQGKLLVQEKLQIIGLHTIPLNLPSGIYMVKTVRGIKTETNKIVVQ
jgi:subtilisin family serine protease